MLGAVRNLAALIFLIAVVGIAYGFVDQSLGVGGVIALAVLVVGLAALWRYRQAS